ncbi:MAG: methyltransferase, partial [Candidatus Eremiobacterota bacterium]
MKVERILERAREHFPLSELPDLSPVRGRLEELGYTEAAVCRRLGVADVNRIMLCFLPLLRQRLEERTLLDRLIDLFLLGGSLSDAEAVEVFEPHLDLWKRARLVVEDCDGRVKSPVDLYPCTGGFFATDRSLAPQFDAHHVYPLGGDSYCLARGVLRQPVDRVLDLCTGSGVQAVTAARFARRVVAVDRNARAVNFARFNCRLNGVGNVEVRLGDLYAPVRGERFDVVLANPPFVPSPRRDLGFRDGGDEVLERIVAGLDTHLSEYGRAQIVTLLVFDGPDYVAKLRGWGAARFDVLVLADRSLDVEQYVLGHLDGSQGFEEYSRSMLEWVGYYRSLGIQRLANGLVALRRADANPRGELRDFVRVARPFWEELALALSDEVPEGRIGLSDRVDIVWEGHQQGRIRRGVLFREGALYLSMDLSRAEKRLLDRLRKGPCPAASLAEEFGREALLRVLGWGAAVL